MSQPPPPPQQPPPSGSDPQIPSPPPPAPPPGYYAESAAPSPPGGAPSAAYAPPARWRSLRGLTTALTWLFSAHIALTVILIIGVFNHLRVLGDEEVLGVVRDTEAVNDANALPAVMILLSGVVFIAIFVLLIIWLYRAAKNNEALGRQNPRLGPGWAIGGWFIPIAWWVIPFIILDDVWRGSDPSIPRGDPSWRRSSTLGAIWAWLVTAVIFIIPSGIASSTGDVRADEPEKVRRDDILRIIGAVGAIVAAVLAIVVTRRIAARQEECLRAQQATAPAT
jgi:heme/copper-type cytochrome/quinol oxidase subunit 2